MLQPPHSHPEIGHDIRNPERSIEDKLTESAYGQKTIKLIIDYYTATNGNLPNTPIGKDNIIISGPLREILKKSEILEKNVEDLENKEWKLLVQELLRPFIHEYKNIFLWLRDMKICACYEGPHTSNESKLAFLKFLQLLGLVYQPNYANTEDLTIFERKECDVFKKIGEKFEKEEIEEFLEEKHKIKWDDLILTILIIVFLSLAVIFTETTPFKVIIFISAILLQSFIYLRRPNRTTFNFLEGLLILIFEKKSEEPQ